MFCEFIISVNDLILALGYKQRSFFFDQLITCMVTFIAGSGLCLLVWTALTALYLQLSSCPCNVSEYEY